EEPPAPATPVPAPPPVDRLVAEVGPCVMPVGTPRTTPPALARSRSASASLGPYRCSSMSRLFSRARATTSWSERYNLPARSNASRRPELDRLMGATSRWVYRLVRRECHAASEDGACVFCWATLGGAEMAAARSAARYGWA